MDLAGAIDDDSDEWESIEKTLYDDRNCPFGRKIPDIEDVQGAQ